MIKLETIIDETRIQFQFHRIDELMERVYFGNGQMVFGIETHF